MSLSALFMSLESKYPTNREMLKQIIYTLNENCAGIKMDSYGSLSFINVKTLF